MTRGKRGVGGDGEGSKAGPSSVDSGARWDAAAPGVVAVVFGEVKRRLLSRAVGGRMGNKTPLQLVRMCRVQGCADGPSGIGSKVAWRNVRHDIAKRPGVLWGVRRRNGWLVLVLTVRGRCLWEEARQAVGSGRHCPHLRSPFGAWSLEHKKPGGVGLRTVPVLQRTLVTSPKWVWKARGRPILSIHIFSRLLKLATPRAHD